MKLWQKWWFWLIMLLAFGAVIRLIYFAINQKAFNEMLNATTPGGAAIAPGTTPAPTTTTT